MARVAGGAAIAIAAISGNELVEVFSDGGVTKVRAGSSNSNALALNSAEIGDRVEYALFISGECQLAMVEAGLADLGPMAPLQVGPGDELVPLAAGTQVAVIAPAGERTVLVPASETKKVAVIFT